MTCLLWLEQCTAYSKVSYKPCFPLLSKDSCNPMVTAVLFIVTKMLKQCPVAEVSTARRWSRKKAAGPGRGEARRNPAEEQSVVGSRVRGCASGRGEQWEPWCSSARPPSASEMRVFSSSGYTEGVSPMRVSRASSGDTGEVSVSFLHC